MQIFYINNVPLSKESVNAKSDKYIIDVRIDVT